MGRPNIAENDIPPLFKKSPLNLLMFGFIRGAREALHTVTIADALNRFMGAYELDIDAFNSQSMAVEYNRMQRELMKHSDPAKWANKLIGSIYYKNSLHLLLFSYERGVQETLPAMRNQAKLMFSRSFSVDHNLVLAISENTFFN